MENQKKVFLAYRAIFDGSNAQIRQAKAITKVVSQHPLPKKSLLKSLGEKQIISTLKELLERKVFQSELKAKLAFPDLYTTSSAQQAQHNASEAHAAKSESEVLDEIASFDHNQDDEAGEIDDEASWAQITR